MIQRVVNERRILDMDTKLRLLEAKVDSAAASAEEAATPAIGGTDVPQGLCSSSLQPLGPPGTIDSRYLVRNSLFALFH